MASSLLLGNLALLLPEAILTPRRREPPVAATKTSAGERIWHEGTMSRCPKSYLSSILSAGGETSHPPPPPSRRRRKTKLAPAAYFSSSPSGSGGGGGDWEKELLSRMKELEELKELERRAEELQILNADDTTEEGEEGGEGEREEEKRERVRRELEKLAKEQAERRETANLMFELGQKAYGKGMYARAIEFLEAALTIVPWPTLFGGEIQIWLAMAYEANNRHRDCIALYQQLEKKHPIASIRRQAAELRYILQAPKLKISKDEMVTMPLIGSSYDRYAGTWSDKYKNVGQRRKIGTTTNQLPSSRDFLGDFMVWRPPVGLEKNPAFWTLLAFWFGLLGTAFLLQR